MASYQRVALFLLFDAIEHDLVAAIRRYGANSSTFLSDEERDKARRRSSCAEEDAPADFELLKHLDLGDKISILMRIKSEMPTDVKNYYVGKRNIIEKAIPVRNATMHGRPLTTVEYALGFSLANELSKSAPFWPNLRSNLKSFSSDPHGFTRRAVTFLSELGGDVCINNLPIPDYDDTGFVPRPDLEADLRKKILSRHPVVTVLGEGGNGKTALTLQCLYGLVESNDHPFAAVLWVSAKSNRLTVSEIKRVENTITSSSEMFTEAANLLEPGSGSAVERLRKLLTDNTVLLAIDNLETIVDEDIRHFASDVPGSSKLLFTSRVPLGSDLTIVVPEFRDREAKLYLRRLIEAYDVSSLKSCSPEELDRYARRLNYKPLLLKWLVHGVEAGLQPERIIANPEMALKFCLENVVDRLSPDAKRVAAILCHVPRPASPGILRALSDLSALEVESGLSELQRFAFLEQDSRGEFERTFQLRQFAKAYLARVVPQVAGASEEMSRRYARFEGEYQAQRGAATRNRFSLAAYDIRSRAELLAASELRRAVQLNNYGNFTEADGLIDSLKVSDPSFYEVYRTEAYISAKRGDFARAHLAYETAVDLEPDKTQLLCFYAGFLMRAQEHERADEVLSRALELDPDEAVLLREAARNKFFRYDFAAAQDLIDRVWRLPFRSLKDEVIVNDLQIQLYTRKIWHHVDSGNPKEALVAAEGLAEFLTNMDVRLMDEPMLAHLLRVGPALVRLERFQEFDPKDIVGKLRRQVSDVLGEINGHAGDLKSEVGEMKTVGRQPNYAFLRNVDEIDTFVSRQEVSEDLWQQMILGTMVQYDVVTNAEGKTKAVNIRPIEQGDR